MRHLLDTLLSRYGIPAQLQTKNGEQEIRVLFRAVRSDAWQNARREFTPLGEVPTGRYICLLPATAETEREATLTLMGKQYLLRRIEPIAVFSEIAGQWCLCVEKGRIINGTSMVGSND